MACCADAASDACQVFSGCHPGFKVFLVSVVKLHQESRTEKHGRVYKNVFYMYTLYVYIHIHTHVHKYNNIYIYIYTCAHTCMTVIVGAIPLTTESLQSRHSTPDYGKRKPGL